MKSALFVDFDNVYSGLRKLDSSIAERFARQPLRWVQWLLSELEAPADVPDGAKRRILVRRVYLNPQVYQGFRAAFNHAGFEIIDCPAMTYQGKTSTDIHMVLDMVDLLQHQVHYEEFIVFSADADFTPLLRKLRRWDRRTTVLAVGFPSAAYRASADLLIDPDVFVREALEITDLDDATLSQLSGNPTPPAMTTVAAAAGSLSTASNPAAPTTPPSLTPNLGSAPPTASSGGFAGLSMPALFSPIQQPDANYVPPFDVERLTERIRAEVNRSDLPVPCARLASRLMAENPGLAPDWCGYGSFRRFVETLSLAPLKLDWSGSGGHLYDPIRHSLKPLVFSPIAPESSWGLDRSTMVLVRQVHDTVGVPLLSPRDFRGLLDAVADDVAEQPFQLSETGKRVRDRCREAGLDVSREDVNWVLRGLLLCGHEFGKGEDDVPTLSYRLVGNLITLCRREQMVIDEGTPAALHRWVSGVAAGMPPPEAPRSE